MSRWFRHYAGMMRDDKLVSVAIRSKQTIERVVWIWGAILESAAEIDDNGRYDVDPAEIAYFLRADESDIHAIIDGLESSGRIAAGVVVKWSNRQFQSDRSAARQAAYRERKRSEKRGSDGVETSGDGRVTSPSRHRDAPEAETETETEAAKAASAREAQVDVSTLMLSLCKAAGLAPPDPLKYFDKHSAYLQIVRDWLDAGADPPSLHQCVSARAAASRNKPGSLRYFDGAVRDAITAKQAQASEATRLIDRLLAEKRRAA